MLHLNLFHVSKEVTTKVQKNTFLNKRGILATPGGDTGEFLLSLATFISLGGSITSQENVSNFLFDFISIRTTPFISLSFTLSIESTQRPFYMHTDLQASQRLNNALATIVPNFTITNVSAQYQAALRNLLSSFSQSLVLEQLVKPEYIGCGHLRSVLTSPVDFQLDSNITQYYIR